VNRPSWQFYGWWGIVLPAFVIIGVTNALTLVGLLLLVGALGPWVTGALFGVTQSYQLGFSLIVVPIAASLAAILFVRLPARATH
jgi:hypothetical protein